MKPIFLNILTLLVLTAANVQAATYYVATNGNDSDPGTQAQPFRNIARGIAVATHGDTVLVADGTYNEHNLDFGTKNLTLRSGSSNPALCILDCQQQGQGFKINGGQMTATVSGLTIRNAVASSNHTGGGMNIDRSSATVSNCVFTACTFTFQNGFGGDALYMDYAPNVTIMGCTFSGNGTGSITPAGALVGNGENGLTLSNCDFTGNTSGAVNLSAGNATVMDCTFTNNSARSWRGSGLAMSRGALVVDRCVSRGNHASNDAGFVGAGGGGGALSYGGVNLTLTNSLFIDNVRAMSINETSSQIWLYATDPVAAKIVNCTLVLTFTEGVYGNVVLQCPQFQDGHDSLIVVNSILRGARERDDIARSGGALATVNNCNVEHGAPSGTGNTNANPNFVNPAGGDYRLQSSSPCHNTGTASAPGLTATDLDGNPRILGSAPDMGAYELWTSASGIWFVDKALGSDNNPGSPTAPFQTVVKAVTSASNGHNIYIKANNYGTDRPRITKSLRLFNWGNTGQARIGKP